ncbi:sensor histidine kinase [Streptomyces sp. NPDC058964]|uniref:sensor histidine kinase n=1 Tax=Streptomyces sp. NPDC058964 TaxID=3346681 RepID=UPI0036C02C8C
MTYLDSIARRRVPQAVVDTVMALLVTVGALAVPAQPPAGPPLADPDTLRLLLALLSGLPLAVHRKWPLPVLLTVAVAVGALQAYDYIPPPVGPSRTSVGAPYLGVASAVLLTAVRSSRRVATAVVTAVVPAVAVAEALMEPGFRMANAAAMVILLVAAWALGRLSGARKAMAQDAVEKAAALAREQHANARAAVAQERARIARELHDIVAHNVSLMVVQTIAADRVQDRHAAKAHELHHAIEQTGRAAVEELRRLLHVLRTDENEDGDPSRQPPQPTLGDIPQLVESVRTAGLDIDFTSTGEPAELPAGSELAVYRVAQEALTNTLKHAGHTRARLSLDWGPDRSLTVRVCDDGRQAGNVPAAPGPAVGGACHGLVGMRERIAAVGGSLHAGPRPGGGFCVHATVPVCPVRAGNGRGTTEGDQRP